jgi:mannose/cellobiose epimerase-like protein (N-acyl-D-glucosamine 2-epimerase family)
MKFENSHFGQNFLKQQIRTLLKFAEGSRLEFGGFGYLNSDGTVDKSKPMESYVQARMIQVFGTGHLMKFGNFESQIRHGILALNNLFHDKENGGYFNSIDLNHKPVAQEKIGYDHVFVLLAASMAKAIGIKEADQTFDHIDSVIYRYFWNSEFQMMNNHWDQAFENLDAYRGMNVNMHAVEALLAAFDLTKNEKYLERAYAISKRSIDIFAKDKNWFLPEHFDSTWEPDLNFNINRPNDPFRPFGVTIGHLFEWARLLIQLHTNLEGAEHEWMLEGARGLYDVGKNRGWGPDGGLGFVYTIDWEGKVVSDQRMWWVQAEAIMAAFALWKITGDDEYIQDYENWWSYVEKFYIDKELGSWRHELNKNQEVVAKTWPGKPDIYHALGASAFPLLPISRSFLGSLIIK